MLTFDWAGSVVSFGADAGVVSAIPDDDPERTYLSGGGSVGARLDGAPVQWGPSVLAVDGDELEVSRRHPRVHAVVRHSFGAGWGVRLALSNPTQQPLRLTAVSLSWTTPPDLPSVALAAGAAAAYGVIGPGGHVLGGVLTLGEVLAVTSTGFDLGAVSLAPGGRYVVQLDWRWFGSVRAFAAHQARHRADRHVPATLCSPAGEVALVTVNEDEALLLPGGVSREQVRDQVELAAYEAGSYPVEVRSGGGTTRFDLTWAPPLAQVLVDAAEAALGVSPNTTGVVVLPGVEVALVVQAALRLRLAETELAEDALDLFTARSLHRDHPDPRLATYLCGEFDRLGDVDLVEAAEAVLVGAEEARAGLGLASGHVRLAQLVSGRPQGTNQDRVVPVHTSESEGFEQRVLLLESSLAGAAAASGVVAERLTDLGYWLGAGLKGRAVRPVPVAARAYAVAVLAAVPDDVARRVQRLWGCSVTDLSRWTEAAVLSELDAVPVGSTHAWLAIAARTR